MKKFAIIFILVLSFTFVLSFQAKAQDSLGFTVFPALQDKDVTPGDSTRLQLQFKNTTQNFISGQVKFADFVVKDELGTPLILENQPVKSKYSAASWLSTLTPNITIPPADFVTVDIYVQVPDEITTCGHYAIAYLEPTIGGRSVTKGRTGGETSITPRIGALLNFKVKNPDCKDDVRVTKFDSPQFAEFGPVNVNFNLLNLGDQHVSPRGVLIMTNMLGKTVSQTTIREVRIFPEAVKVYTTSLGEKWMAGRYKIALSGYSNGPKNVPFTAYTYVWVFPWRVAVVVFLAILIFILLGRKFYSQMAHKESLLEEEIEHEKEEIEKLKTQLRNRKE